MVPSSRPPSCARQVLPSAGSDFNSPFSKCQATPLLSLATDQPAEESKGNESKSVQHTQTALVSASTGQDAVWRLHPALPGLSWATCLVAFVLENNTQVEALGLPPDPDPGVK